MSPEERIRVMQWEALAEALGFKGTETEFDEAAREKVKEVRDAQEE